MQRCDPARLKSYALLEDLTRSRLPANSHKSVIRVAVIVILSLLFILAASRTAEASLYFPHVTNPGSWDTEICVVNISDSVSLTGHFRASDPQKR